MPCRRLLSVLPRLPQKSPLYPSSSPRTVRILPHIQRRGVNTYGILVLQPSFWRQLVPKPLRKDPDDPRLHDVTATITRSKSEWNPATFYLVMFMLVGSMAINLLLEKKDFAAFSRDADLRIAKLREVLRKVQNGEAVDVERELGTGDPAQEREWEEVMKEIRSLDTPKKNTETKESNKKEEEDVKIAKSVREFY